MKAQELRIGNFLSDKVSGTLLKVDYISKESFGVYVLDRSKYPLPEGWEAEPIPITEQWLIDFGLLQDPNHKCFHIKGMEFDLPIMSGGYHDNEYGLDEENRITLFYLHQLQNLYFVLTGKELTKK